MVSASLTSSPIGRLVFGASGGARDEHLRLVQRLTDEIGGDRREDADREHAAPADDGKQDRRQDGRGENAELPSEADIGGHAPAHRGRPGFGDQRHADAELAAEPDARDGAVGEQVPIALRQRAHAGEDREQHDGPGQNANAADAVGQHAEDDAADHGADQCRGDQRGALRRAKSKIGGNQTQHEAEDQKIEAVHRIAERRAQQGFLGLLLLRGREVFRNGGAGVGSGFEMAHDESPVSTMTSVSAA